MPLPRLTEYHAMVVRRSHRCSSMRGWLVFLPAACVALAGAASLNADAPDFERQIAPVLVKRCLECHNQRHFEGGLVLESAAKVAGGGDSGPAIVPGKPAESYLLSRVEAGEMPPAKKGQPQKLAQEEIEVLKDWIAAGAPWPAGRTLDLFEKTTDVHAGRDWWSLQPLQQPAIPDPNAGPSSRPPLTVIDTFIQQQLNLAGMAMAPPADLPTLLRRLYSDVTGLPPASDDLQAALAGNAPDAYERTVDRLLASPRFGERYARHWLDLVRFAETSGYERDQEKPYAWRYRDWVVNALNHDKPYDRWVLEQLAGDELADRSAETVIATGFLRLGTWNDEPNDPEEYKYERLEDIVHATSTAFLGLTVKCARCHDHKFDPIWQTDYYRMASAFWPGPIEARQRELLGGPSKDELGYDVLGWTDLSPDSRPLHLLKKGDPRHPADEVAPASLSFLPSLERAFQPPPATAKTTQRRLQLAQWMVHPQNPLTPRVIVNRLWLHHFGQGLVRTVNDFGFSGEQPTHPQLLDWLATELQNGGWELKRLHRLMLNSAVYRQSSVHPLQSELAKRDAANQLWWHAERRRLDAESLRDAMLAVSGELDLQMRGPSFRPTLSPEALEGLSRKSAAWQPSRKSEQLRRSLYMYSQRSLLVPLMTTFDFSDTTLPCGQRDVTTVAPQALALLNNTFVHERSSALADQARRAAGNRGEQVAWLWRQVFGRAPAESERQAALTHLAEQERHFASLPQTPVEPPPARLPTTNDLALHLRADAGVSVDERGLVHKWQDQSLLLHDALQDDDVARPLLVVNAAADLPAIRFDGQKTFLRVAGQVITSQQFTILAVIRDATTDASHRGIFSNWNGAAGNSVRSVFLGLTGKSSVRLSDDFTAAGALPAGKFFLLAAVAKESDAGIAINGNELTFKGSPLSPRNLTTAYVIGQQGNIDGEYFRGDIAELIVFNRALEATELEAVQRYLIGRYKLLEPPQPPTPAELALASLCHVLLNTNEFIYVD